MDENINGKHKGHDRNGKDARQVIEFPSLAERDRLCREKEKLWRDAYRQRKATAKKAAYAPFFNKAQIPPLTFALTGLFVALFLTMELLIPAALKVNILLHFSFIPGRFSGAAPWIWTAPLTPLSHMLLHGDAMHILFNAVMTLALGTFFEREFGSRTFLLFFLLCGIAGAAFSFILSPFSAVPIIGASGGISGLFGALISLFHSRGLIGGRRGVWPLILFWAAFIIVPGLLFGDIAWQAHLGGFLGGIGLLQLMQRGKIRL